MFNKNDWNLILVNSNNGLKKEYFDNLELEVLHDEYKLDSRIISITNQMLYDAKNDGFELLLFSGYRDIFRQIKILSEQINKYLDDGYDICKARNLSLSTIAIPGFSEHHTGLAIDIFSKDNELYDDKDFEKTDDFIWLKNNSYKYGYILRYQKDKTDITNIAFEPWHFRYVGIEAATIIYNENLCLEEFIEKYAK